MEVPASHRKLAVGDKMVIHAIAAAAAEVKAEKSVIAMEPVMAVQSRKVKFMMEEHT
jgi:hypothetical protein